MSLSELPCLCLGYFTIFLLQVGFGARLMKYSSQSRVFMCSVWAEVGNSTAEPFLFSLCCALAGRKHWPKDAAVPFCSTHLAVCCVFCNLRGSSYGKRPPFFVTLYSPCPCEPGAKALLCTWAGHDHSLLEGTAEFLGADPEPAGIREITVTCSQPLWLAETCEKLQRPTGLLEQDTFRPPGGLVQPYWCLTHHARTFSSTWGCIFSPWLVFPVSPRIVQLTGRIRDRISRELRSQLLLNVTKL